MDAKRFLWDNTLAIVFNAAGLIAVGIFTGITAGALAGAIIAAGWAAALTIYLAVSYAALKKRIARIKKTAADTEDKFLLSEIVPAPQRCEDSLYYELMLLQGRATIERINKAEKDKREYYDYVHEWVHEVKIPITAASLICDRNDAEEFREISRQLGKINDYTEQVLYEAKSSETAKDLLIRRTELSAVVNDCVKEHKRYFIEAGLRIETKVEGFVCTDEKWLGFILKQLLYNCAQYSRGENAAVKICSRALAEDRTELSITDNGVGILASELPRIFDKGFTGSNGRKNKNSTGMGLYLCKKLCRALDIELTAASVAGEFTRMSLVFNAPKENMLTKL